MKKIAYLIPEFPGQTQSFFWREIVELEKLGIRVEIASTRKPKVGITSHNWVNEALKRTTYLYPIPFKTMILSLSNLILCGLASWKKLFKTYFSSEVSGFKERIRLLGLMFVGAELAYIAKQKKWEHIHVHSCGDSANIALFASCISGICYSLTLHNPLNVYGSNQKNKWKNATFGIIISKKIFDEVQQQLAGYLPPKLVKAPMGVNLKDFEPSKESKRANIHDRLDIFSCGRLNYVKGHDILVQAMNILHKMNIKASLRLAGGKDDPKNPYSINLKKLIDESANLVNIKLLGPITEEQVKNELNLCNVFVFPSRQEPTGVALMEAMAMELPIIASNVDGIPEVVENEKSGLLIPSNDPQAIVDALLRLMENPEFAHHLALSARKKIEQQFSSSISAKAIFDFL